MEVGCHCPIFCQLLARCDDEVLDIGVPFADSYRLPGLDLRRYKGHRVLRRPRRRHKYKGGE